MISNERIPACVLQRIVVAKVVYRLSVHVDCVGRNLPIEAVLVPIAVEHGFVYSAAIQASPRIGVRAHAIDSSEENSQVYERECYAGNHLAFDAARVLNLHVNFLAVIVGKLD